MSRLHPRTLALPAVLTVLFLGRVLMFAAAHGGVEHDSGWYLGIAKNLALRGIYASDTNTIVDDGPGVFTTIHGRPSYQDQNGYREFEGEISVGPGYVLPEALVLKVFGCGWPQYRLWPVATFTALLFGFFLALSRAFGRVATLTAAVWLWLVPQFYVNFAYESLSEPAATLYLLLGIAAVIWLRRPWGLVVGGLLFGAAALTKMVFLLGGLGFAPLFWSDLRRRLRPVWRVFGGWGLWAMGAAAPAAAFNAWRYAASARLGAGVFAATNQAFMTFLSSEASRPEVWLDVPFIERKARIWWDLGLESAPIGWLLAAGGIYALRRIADPKWRQLFVCAYTVMWAFFLWFVLKAHVGWARYVWPACLIAVAVGGATVACLLREASAFPSRAKVMAYGLLAACALASARWEVLDPSLVLTDETAARWHDIRRIRDEDGLPPIAVVSRADQEELLRFFSAEIQPADRVFYLGGFLVAEASALADKVFFPLERYYRGGARPPPGGRAYLAFGPYQQGPWSMVDADYVERESRQRCTKTVFQNGTYRLCLLASP